MMVIGMDKVIVEVIGIIDNYKSEFETWEDAEKYCEENKYYFDNVSMFITQGDKYKLIHYRKMLNKE